MGNLWFLLYLFLGGVLGVVFQAICRPAVWINLLVSFGVVTLIHPGWSLGIIGGIWIKSAFFDMNIREQDHLDQQEVVSWFHIFIVSLFTFAGFLLTLVMVWKIKTLPGFGIINHREWLAWAFLIFIEVSFYRIIAKLYMIWQRIRVGLGMGFLNFLMILYWVYPYGLAAVLLTFLSLILLNPALLIWVDRPIFEKNEI